MKRPEWVTVAIVEDLNDCADDFDREAHRWTHAAERMACERWGRYLREIAARVERNTIDIETASDFLTAGNALTKQVRAMRKLTESIVPPPILHPTQRGT